MKFRLVESFNSRYSCRPCKNTSSDNYANSNANETVPVKRTRMDKSETSSNRGYKSIRISKG